MHTRRKATSYRSVLAHEEIIVDGFNEKNAIIASIASLALIFGVAGDVRYCGTVTSYNCETRQSRRGLSIIYLEPFPDSFDKLFWIISDIIIESTNIGCPPFEFHG